MLHPTSSPKKVKKEKKGFSQKQQIRFLRNREERYQLSENDSAQTAPRVFLVECHPREAIESNGHI
jgi:hypothetical protein